MRLVDVRPGSIDFGFSVVRECLRAIEVYLDSSHHAEQMPWVREARRRLPAALRARVERLLFFVDPTPETFPFAWPEGEAPSFDVELTALREDLPRYRDAVLKRVSGERLFTAEHVRALRRPRWFRPAVAEYSRLHPRSAALLAEFLASPDRSLRAFCATLEDFHAHAVEHRWGGIAHRLRNDVAMRRRILDEHGPAALVRTLSRTLSVSPTRRGITIDCPPGGANVPFGERGTVVFTPSFFCWPHVQVFVSMSPRGPQATIAYPIPPLPMRARPPIDAALLVDACKALGDPVRLRIVDLLRERALSTRELAGFLDLSEPVVSRHLHRLARAGLVGQERDGYFVLYRLRSDTVKRVTAALTVLASESATIPSSTPPARSVT